MSKGRDWRTKPSVMGECEDCDKEFYTRNGVGLAAQHARRYDHTVRVESTIALYFNDKREPAKDTE